MWRLTKSVCTLRVLGGEGGGEGATVRMTPQFTLAGPATATRTPCHLGRVVACEHHPLGLPKRLKGQSAVPACLSKVSVVGWLGFAVGLAVGWDVGWVGGVVGSGPNLSRRSQRERRR